MIRRDFLHWTILLYGLGDTDDVIVTELSKAEYSEYLLSLTDRLKDISTQVLSDWQGGYRDSFVNNNGSGATASVDKMVNDFLFYYEKFLRAGKLVFLQESFQELLILKR